MPEPIQPAGFRDLGAVEEAQRQDEERARRAANEHAQRTGTSPRVYEPPDPLVPSEVYEMRRDIANDGDAYELTRSLSDLFTVEGGEREEFTPFSIEDYAEDRPSQLITNSARNRDRRLNDAPTEIIDPSQRQNRSRSQEQNQSRQEKNQITKALEERRSQVKDALSDLDF